MADVEVDMLAGESARTEAILCGVLGVLLRQVDITRPELVHRYQYRMR